MSRPKKLDDKVKNRLLEKEVLKAQEKLETAQEEPITVAQKYFPHYGFLHST